MDIFELILSPFIFIIKQFFMFSYGLTHNYGAAIILLSFFISVLLLPVFILIEKAKKKDDVIKRKMQPLVDEIKRVYKGQERYYYLKTLNRQHNYSPFKALVPILSLLLQIPFFIAAYQYLEHLEALQGVSFWFIKDLSLADGFLGGVNLLPIAMTLVNLITAYFYTRKGSKTELKQMIGVAVAFLVLLYGLPAALLLYWTMNNVFSFFRLFVTNPEVFKYKSIKKESFFLLSLKSDKRQIFVNSLIMFIPLSIFAVIMQWNWAVKHTFEGFYARTALAIMISLVSSFLIIVLKKVLKIYKDSLLNINMLPRVFFTLIFSSVYFYLAAIFYYSGVDLAFANLSLLLLLPVQYVGFLYYYAYWKQHKGILMSLTSLVLLALSILQFVNLVLFILGKSYDLSLSYIQLVGEFPILSFIKFGIISTLILSYSYLKQTQIREYKPRYTYGIFILSVLYILGSIFFWNPLITFSSFPDAFEYSAIDILNKNLPYFLILIVSLVFVFIIIPKRIKYILLLTTVIVSVMSFIDTTIIPIDLGSLQVNKYSEQINLAAPFSKYIVELLLFLFTILIISSAFSNGHSSKILLGLFLLNGILIYQSLEKSLSTDRFFHKKDYLLEMESIMNFSKTEKNVVLIIPDMLQGWSMNKILKENPSLYNNLSGFVWYSNTLSISRVTNTSMPAIIGGYDCTPDKLDLDKEHTIKQKMTSIVKTFVQNAHSKEGAVVTSNKLPYTSMNDVDIDVFIPYWHKKWDVFNNKLKIGKNVYDGYEILIENALLYSMPLVIKSEIYNKGTWFDKYKEKSKININTWMAKRYNFIRVLPYISSAKSEKPTLNIVYSFTTHFPWNTIDEKGVFHENTSPYSSDKWFINNIEKWFEWMKKNDVYDNTKIIIVSDHGVPWHRYDKKRDIDNPFKNINEDVVSLEWMLGLNPLLLVKDFNKTASLKNDSRFMTNIDVNSIIFDKSNPTNGPVSKHRVLKGFISWWIKDLDNRKQFEISHSYIVKDNIFDGNNWKLAK